MEAETYAIEDARLAHYQNASSAYYVVYRMRLQNISLWVTSHRTAAAIQTRLKKEMRETCEVSNS